MDFILGIFTGITLSLAYGNHLIRQRKKKEQEERGRNIENVRKLWSAIRITPEDLEYLNSSPPSYPFSQAHAKYLNKLIQEAVERDDFEEAARLRDLMNKK